MNKRSVILSFGKFNPAFHYREDSMVFTHSYSKTRMVSSSALTDNDIASQDILPAVTLDAQTATGCIATVAG